MTGVRIDVVDPRSARATWAMTQYFDELAERFPGGFDPGDSLTADAHEMEAPVGTFLVVIDGDDATIACGGVRTIGHGVGEIKRMWVAPSTRGRGIGPRLLGALESAARELGHHIIRLDTNEHLPEAIRMYERAGYTRIDRYNDNPYPTHFYERHLDPLG